MQIIEFSKGKSLSECKKADETINCNFKIGMVGGNSVTRALSDILLAIVH